MSYYVLSNKSDCGNLSIYTAGESKEFAYKQMQAMMFATISNCEPGVVVQMISNPAELTGYLLYSDDEREDFRCISSFDITPIEEVDIENTNFDAIPDELDLDEEGINYVIFDIGREDGESDDM